MDIPVAPGPLAPVTPVAPGAASPVSERAQARRETLRLLLRRPAFIVGSLVILFWVVDRHPRRGDHAVRPVQRLLGRPPATVAGAPVRHGPARAGRPVAGHGRIARRADRRAPGRAARRVGRHAPRADHGLLPRHRRRRPQPARRGVPGPAGHPGRAAHAGGPRLLAARGGVRSSGSCSRRSWRGPSARPSCPSASSTT